MATCHSITKIDSVVVGDPLDIKMFECTDYELIEQLNTVIVQNSKNGFEIVKRFEFQSKL